MQSYEAHSTPILTIRNTGALNIWYDQGNDMHLFFFCVQCSDSGGVKCITNDGAHFVNPNLFGVKKSSSDIFSSFGSFFSSALSLPFNLFKGISGLFGGAWTYVQYVFYFMIFLFLFWLFNQCGGANLIQKLFKKGSSQKVNW